MQISSFLRGYKARNLCFPSHSRGRALPTDLKKLLQRRPGIWDLPELPAFGGPLISDGAVADSQRFSARSFDVDHCWYGVNGATGLLQSAILSVAKPGSAVLAPRNVHRSVIQACALGDITPVLFDLPFNSDTGHFQPPNVSWMKKVLDQLEIDEFEIEAAILVNPFYQGYSVDLTPLVELLHSKNWPVIIDESHGSHFVLGLDELPKSGLKVKADLVVHSLHKSSTGLSQTAVLWLQGNRVDPMTVERSIGLFQTTSPSSLLLASCEASLREWKTPQGEKKLISRISSAKKIFYNLQKNAVPLVETQDPLRLVLHTAKSGLTGFQVDEWMMAKGIVAELPEPGSLTFSLGLGSQRDLFKLLLKNWQKLISLFPRKPILPPFSTPPFSLISRPEISCISALTSSQKRVLIEDALGEISADLICPYPPGIPMLIPGELIEKGHIDWLLDQRNLWPDQIPTEIKVLA